MTAPMLTVRDDDLRYRDWRAWRALRANPGTVVVHETRTQCPECWGQKQILHPIFRRHPDLTRMGKVDASRRPHYLPVLCERCRGLGHLVTVTAVEVTE